MHVIYIPNSKLLKKNWFWLFYFNQLSWKVLKVLEIARRCSSSPWISYVTEALLGAPGKHLERQVNDELFEATEAGSIITHCPPFLRDT